MGSANTMIKLAKKLKNYNWINSKVKQNSSHSVYRVRKWTLVNCWCGKVSLRVIRCYRVSTTRRNCARQRRKPRARGNEDGRTMCLRNPRWAFFLASWPLLRINTYNYLYKYILCVCVSELVSVIACNHTLHCRCRPQKKGLYAVMETWKAWLSKRFLKWETVKIEFWYLLDKIW